MASTAENLFVAPRAWYSASVADFLQADPETIVGLLATNSEFPVVKEQRDAWLAQIEILKEELHGFCGSLLFEFSIPRMGRRIDTVLLVGPIVFAVEFKTGDYDVERAAVDQAWDYALDLK